jgi:hypothetical protein
MAEVLTNLANAYRLSNGTENFITPSLGEAPVMEIRYCPETSKDANGSTGIIDIRWFLM